MTEKKRKIIPPVYLLTTLVLMWVTYRFLPLYVFIHAPWRYAGVLVTLTGIAMAAYSAGLFKKAETGIVPFDEATTLVTGGLYRYTRNPMYLGMIVMLLGVAVLFGNAGSLLPIPLFILVIRNNFVLGEERFLETAFGQQYVSYKSTVRRWI